MDSGNSLVFFFSSIKKASISPRDTKTGEAGSNARGGGKVSQTKGKCGKESTSRESSLCP